MDHTPGVSLLPCLRNVCLINVPPAWAVTWSVVLNPLAHYPNSLLEWDKNLGKEINQPDNFIVDHYVLEGQRLGQYINPKFWNENLLPVLGELLHLAAFEYHQV